MSKEERNLIEDATPNSTRAVTKWSLKIFLEWQNGRKNKNPAIEKTVAVLIINSYS